MKRRSRVQSWRSSLPLGLGVGAAFAYFTATGHGTGSATNGTAPPSPFRPLRVARRTRRFFPGRLPI